MEKLKQLFQIKQNRNITFNVSTYPWNIFVLSDIFFPMFHTLFRQIYGKIAFYSLPINICFTPETADIIRLMSI